MKKYYILYLLFVLPFISYAQIISLDLYRPVPANTCENRPSYVYTQSRQLRSELGLKGRRCDDYIIFWCFPVRNRYIFDIYPRPQPSLPGTAAFLQPAIPEHETLPIRDLILPYYENQIYSRNADVVIQNWKNTTITIKNTRL